MFCPLGYIPYSQASVWFDEWRSKLISIGRTLGYPGNLPENERLFVERILNTADWALEQVLFLENCSDAAICGFDGTLLRTEVPIFFGTLEDIAHGHRTISQCETGENDYLFVDIETFTISCERWRAVQSDTLIALDDWERSRLEVIGRIATKFEGWSYCIRRRAGCTLGLAGTIYGGRQVSYERLPKMEEKTKPPPKKRARPS